jgi:hypothetical protein
MGEEKFRFLSRLDALDLDPDLSNRLRIATVAVQQARDVEDAEALLPASPPGPDEVAGPRKTWRDSLRNWWNG